MTTPRRFRVRQPDDRAPVVVIDLGGGDRRFAFNSSPDDVRARIRSGIESGADVRLPSGARLTPEQAARAVISVPGQEDAA